MKTKVKVVTLGISGALLFSGFFGLMAPKVPTVPQELILIPYRVPDNHQLYLGMIIPDTDIARKRALKVSRSCKTQLLVMQIESVVNCKQRRLGEVYHD